MRCVSLLSEFFWLENAQCINTSEDCSLNSVSLINESSMKVDFGKNQSKIFKGYMKPK